MQLLCPECCSEDVDPHPDPRGVQLRCANCGEVFDRGDAHVTLAEAESHMPDPVPEELFVLDADRAGAELSDPDGAIDVVDTRSDADELEHLVEAAQGYRIVRGPGGLARVAIRPSSVAAPDPLVAVRPGRGPILLGSRLDLRRRDDEDPVAFTIRILEEIVDEANALASGRAADSDRLDRLAALLNQPGRRDDGQVREFIVREILASGRRLPDADDQGPAAA